MGKHADEASTQSTSCPSGMASSVRVAGASVGKFHRHKAEIHARGAHTPFAQVLAQKRLQGSDVQAHLAGVFQQKGQDLALAAKHALHLRALGLAAVQEAALDDLVPQPRGPRRGSPCRNSAALIAPDGGAKAHVEAQARLLQRLPDAELVGTARTAAAEHQSPLQKQPSPRVRPL